MVRSAPAPALRRCGNRWYVFGAQAVAVWGRPRLSADVDITAAIACPRDELEEEFLDRAQAVDLAGMTVPVISPEDLVVTKLLAGRSKDVEDVRTILQERHSRLDLARIRALLGLLQQALSRSDLAPEFETLLVAARKADGSRVLRRWPVSPAARRPTRRD